MNKPLILSAAALLILGIVAQASADTERLKAGDTLPEVTVQDAGGKSVTLQQAVNSKPAVIVFYRGAWCPYCAKHLDALSGAEQDIKDLGYQLIAISVDQPSKLREMPAIAALDYTLLSDSSTDAAEAFGIAYQVDDATVKKYKEKFKIDLEAASGQTHHRLPHPAVYIVDKSGVIKFAHVNENYRERLAPEKVLAAVKQAAAE